MSFPSMTDASGRTVGEGERAVVARVLRSGMLNSVWETEVRALEGDMADLHGVSHAVAASSGTAALPLAVAAVAPDPGDEVITSPISDFGTVAPILAQNAVPVFAALTRTPETWSPPHRRWWPGCRPGPVRRRHVTSRNGTGIASRRRWARAVCPRSRSPASV